VLPAASASALVQGRTSLWVAQIEVSLYSLCRSRDRLRSMWSLACRNSNCVWCSVSAVEPVGPDEDTTNPCWRTTATTNKVESAPEQVDSKSDVVIEKDGDGFSITSIHLTVTAKIQGIDRNTFQSIASKAKAWCPVSKLMNTDIGFEATLVA
jgi:hypothetical protein